MKIENLKKNPIKCGTLMKMAKPFGNLVLLFFALQRRDSFNFWAFIIKPRV